MAIAFEWLYRNGIGNAVAAVMGFATLLVAHSLAASGDTFTVLQAVLDTQFWLATHVVAVTFGYATTFLAGGLGVMYVLGFVVLPAALKLLKTAGGPDVATPLGSDTGKELTRMVYGTLCFSIFFSFFGTVLGGLWADDSWGRFWGWDPKENGALIIVLWTALVLHARWGGMVRERASPYWPSAATSLPLGPGSESMNWVSASTRTASPKACCWPSACSSAVNWRSSAWVVCPATGGSTGGSRKSRRST